MDAVEKRLARMLADNPTRTNFQTHYEEIVAAYNGEKDRVTIEATFEALLKFVAALDDEASRAMREGLDDETLTLFDLLKKPDLRSRRLIGSRRLRCLFSPCWRNANERSTIGARRKQRKT